MVRFTISVFVVSFLGFASPAGAELPDTATLLADLGLSPEEIAQVHAGKLVRHAVPSASERELTTGLAFQVPVSPSELVKESAKDLLCNAEQAVAAFLPSQAGTVVVYANRTSTDQITGFGAGTKRSLGSKVLASQLEGMFEKARARVK